MDSSKYVRKCNDKYNRKIVLQYSMKNELIREWVSAGSVARELGFDKSAILRCCKGKQQRSYWFIWKFKDEVESKPDEANTSITSQAFHPVEISNK